MSVLDNWQQWKDFLGERLEQGQDQGMNQSTVSEIAYQIAGSVEPKNDQEKILADLWSVASEEEQHAIANLVVKLVQK